MMPRWCWASAQVTMLAGTPFSGVVPNDMFGRLSQDLRTNGCMVLADLCGEQLKSALEGGLDLLKISHEEMIADGYAESDTVEHLFAGIDALQGLGAENVVVTRSSKPALARLDGKHYQVSGPQLEPRDYRGSGDSFTAGSAWLPTFSWKTPSVWPPPPARSTPPGMAWAPASASTSKKWPNTFQSTPCRSSSRSATRRRSQQPQYAGRRAGTMTSHAAATSCQPSTEVFFGSSSL